MLHCDELRVTQVLLNLLSNALKFTPTNGRIDIKVRYINSNDSLLGVHPDLQPFVGRDEILMISVTDNGTGIKEEDMGKLFTLYGFIQETKEINTRGIGLGLYICRKIVR